jgi:hypothetical protein
MVMSDDPPTTPRPVISPDWGIPSETGARLLLTPDEMDAKTDRQLRDVIKGLIDSVETGIHDGAEKVAVIATAQYYMQELARRTQDRQTKSIIAMTKAIKNMTAIVAFMTFVIMVATIWIMVATIWPDWLRPVVHSLWIRASQVIDLWWPRG